MKRAVAGLFAIAALVTLATTAGAGEKITETVFISTTTGAGDFYGSVAAARASADANQYIGCNIVANSAGAISGECAARNAAGTYRTCHSSVASVVQAMGTVNGMSDLLVYFDASGACTSVTVRNYSYFGPEAP